MQLARGKRPSAAAPDSSPPAAAAPAPDPAPQPRAGAATSAATSARDAVRSRIADAYRNFGPWTSQRQRGITHVPENAVKGVLAIGPGTTALVGAGFRAARNVATTLLNPPGSKEGQEASAELGGGVRAIAQGAVETAKEAVRDPYGFVTKNPVEVATAVEGGAKLLAKPVAAAAGAAERAATPRLAAMHHGTPPGMPFEHEVWQGVKEASRALRKPAETVAKHGLAKPVAGAVDAAVRDRVPVYDELRTQQEAHAAAADVIRRAESDFSIAQAKGYKVFHDNFADLNDDQRAEFIANATGQANVPPSARVASALEAFKATSEQFQHEWMKRGMLNEPFDQARRVQAARIEEFGSAVPRVIKGDAERAAAEAAVTDERLNDFVRNAAKQGGSAGPIEPARLRQIGRYLGQHDPQTADPMALAKEVWGREVARLQRMGKYRGNDTDFETFLRSAKRGGSYTNMAAPLARQIEGIVKGYLWGREEPFPKGLIAGAAPKASEMEAVEAEARRLLDSKRGPTWISDQIRGRASSELAKIATERADAGQVGDDIAEMQRMMAEGTPLSREEIARVLEAHPEVRRAIGGRIEENIQYARESSRFVQRRMPRLAQLPSSVGQRRVFQLTREEFDALPVKTRIRRMGSWATGLDIDSAPPETWYDHVITRAVQKGAQVPLDVLETNRDWLDEALTPPNRRLMHATDEVVKALEQKGQAEPMYFPWIREPLVFKWRNLFSRASKAEKVKPKSLRTSHGTTYASGEFVDDPKLLAARQQDDFLRYRRAEQIIQGVLAKIQSKEIPGRVIQSPADLLPGETAWNPDGLRMWRQQLEFGSQFLKEMQNFGTGEEGAARALAAAVKKGIGEGAWHASEQGYLKPKTYAIPASVAKLLSEQFREAPGWVRYAFDPLQSAWRWWVLTARPAWIANNTIGNTIFSTLNGVAPRHYLMALQEQFGAKMPDNLNGIHLSAAEADLGLVRAQGGPLGNLIDWLDSKPSPIGATDLLGKKPNPALMALRIGDPRRFKAVIDVATEKVNGFNQSIEAFYRRANFLKEAEKLSRQRVLQNAGKSALESMSLLDEMDKLSPADLDRIVEKVNYFMHDYAALNPWERNYLRRAVPFVNFLKLQTRLLVSLPFDYPGRAAMLQSLAAIGSEAQAADNARLPEWARDRGYTDLGMTVYVDGRPMRAFLTTGGSNPFIMGWGPMASAEGVNVDAPGLVGAAYGVASPIFQYLAMGMAKRGYEPVSGRPLTYPNLVEKDGKFYDAKTLEEVEPPLPDPVSYAVSKIPAFQLGRRLVNPRAGYTGAPLSLASSRETATTTPLLQLLKYFTPASIVLVDQNDVRRPTINVKDLRSVAVKAGVQQGLRDADEERSRLEMTKMKVQAPR